MKLFISCVLALAAATSAAAQTPAPKPGTGVAVIRFNEAVLMTADGQKAKQAIDNELKPLLEDFKKKQGEIEGLQKKLQDSSVSDAERASLNRQIEDAQRSIQRIDEDASRKYAEAQEKYLPGIVGLVNKVIDAYAKEMGLAVVFDVQTQPNNIVFASDVSDITTEVVRRTDIEAAKSPPKAAAPDAPPATPKPPAPKPPTSTTPAPKPGAPAPPAPKTP